MAEKEKIIFCDNLVKIYKTKDIEVVALQGLDLIVEEGELMAIIGNSGSGKSTLLNMIGGLDKPTAGTLTVCGHNMLTIDKKETVEFKKRTVGFMWQNNARNLIPYLTALENVELPMRLAGKVDRDRAKALLDEVGLGKRTHNRLHELSGGEQQRVAIAIALANQPKLLLADEPTGAVDTKTSAAILDMFKRLNREIGLTIVIVTHDISMTHFIDRTVAIRDGRTSSEIIRRNYRAELSNIQDPEQSENSHEELLVLDRFNRLQIPSEYANRAGIAGKGKVRAELRDDGILISQINE